MRKRDNWPSAYGNITFQYDALNRLTLKVVPERPGLDPAHSRDVHYGYDLRNLQLHARFDSATGEGVTSTYDGFGRQLSQSINLGGTTRTLSYAYDRGGNRTRLTHPDGTAFDYAWDGLNRPTYLSSPTSWAANMVYYDHGAPMVMSRLNGTASDWFYDGLQRPFAIDLYPLGAAHGGSWQMTRNPAGQIGSITRSNDAYAWGGHYAVNRAYTTNGLNQYSAAGGATFTYDANGNLTGDGTRTYGYDIENRLVSASGGVTLAYDPLGRLHRVTAPSSNTTFLYDGDALVAEYNGATLLRRYAHWVGADVPAIWYEGATLTDPRYLFSDHQGSIVAAVNASGTAILNRYDEYGIPASTNNGRFQYTGQIWLPEIGMYHYKARVYSPYIGRFLQTDPIGYEDQFNLYAYVAGDPINHVDPDGRVTLYLEPDQNCCGGGGANGDWLTGEDVRYAVGGGSRGSVANPLVVISGTSAGADRATVRPSPGSAGAGRASTLRPGPFAGRSIPARNPSRNFTRQERREINQIMRESGCHTCGTRNPGTRSDNAIPDHQPTNALNPPAGEQRLYPHCLDCSTAQMREARREQLRIRRERRRENED